MDISYFGVGCVKISGKQVDIVCDPYDEKSGLGKIKTSSDVVLVSGYEPGVNGVSGMLIDGPGEYEVKGAMITGIPARLHIDEAGDRGTIYSIIVDGLNVAFLGNITPELSDKQVEGLGQVDVLVVPVGGHGLTLDSVAAAAMVSRLEPKYVVPTHYDDGKTTYPMPQELLAKFLSEVGATNVEPITKLKLSSKEMPTETTVVILQRVGA